MAHKHRLRFLLILAFTSILNTAHATPVVSCKDCPLDQYTVPENICILPKELDYSGFTTLIEDCDSLDQFTSTPPSIDLFFGSTVIVCCPKKDPITFPIDQEYQDYDDPPPSENPDPIDPCPEKGDGSLCTPINECSDEDFAFDEPPTTCGYTSTNGIDKVCCKNVIPSARKPQPKKYGSKNYDCQDMNPVCSQYIKRHPDACKPNNPFYDFMRVACMKTCGRCGDVGCVDEFEKCEEWTRNQKCIANSDFMFFQCRESCGACGFRYPLNQDPQVVNGRDYSDIRSDLFFCGEGKLKKDIAPPISKDMEVESNPEEVVHQQRKRSADVSPAIQSPALSDNFVFFAYTTNNSTIQCGSTIINDKFFVFAAHCKNAFENPDSHQVKAIILRDDLPTEEYIEVRRLFVHPFFDSPSLYHDIAIGELGRRIIFDYDRFGDSPACLSNGVNIVDKIAISQGYGFTEKGVTSDVLLEGNVTVIDNKLCDEWLRLNTSSARDLKRNFENSLPMGIVDSLMCTKGIYNATLNAYSGPCPGDSGGPLYVNHGDNSERKLRTLEGIVSGGIGCGVNSPTWYTRVSAFRPWIECIIEKTKAKLSQQKINGACLHLARADKGQTQ